MPITDSAGVGVFLVDKSQRASTAIGYRAAVAIEAARGLCNKPALIASTKDFVKVFGSPSYDQFGLANLEAYRLAQNKVPLVVVRAANPNNVSTDPVFGCIRVTNSDGVLVWNSSANANSIATPADANTSCIYFKGEGTYASEAQKNIVVRVSEPSSKSAYANVNRAFQLQVFDFNGASHIDQDQAGVLALNPVMTSVVDGKGNLSLASSGFDTTTVVGSSSTVTAYVNGKKGTAALTGSVYDAIVSAVTSAKDSSGKAIVSEADFHSNGDGTFTVTAGSVNCFNLSISIAISATASVSSESVSSNAYLSFGCGSVTVAMDEDSSSSGAREGVATFKLSMSTYLQNTHGYMFMGDENENWAAYYNSYLQESWIASFSFEDYDSNYVTMQIDSVLAASNYLVSKTNSIFDTYDIGFQSESSEGSSSAEESLFVKNLTYFDTAGTGLPNTIDASSKSYAYAAALGVIMGDNLTKWHCVATVNLGDVMNPGDFTSATESSNECTLGLSNIGRAASLDVLNNLTGRHGNRFIADFAQYGLRNVSGRRVYVTMASLVADLLNTNYNNGAEARPPFGFTYGQISCDGLSQEYTGVERQVLAQTYKINPVISDGGYFLWENLTSQITNTSLSDTSSILSYCWMKFAIYDSMKSFVAEYNDQDTVNRGLRVLRALNRDFQTKKYIEEGIVSADKNVIGDTVMRFDYAVRFKGVTRFVNVYVTAYSQTQTLAISLGED